MKQRIAWTIISIATIASWIAIGNRLPILTSVSGDASDEVV
jgi:hypothetical protein